MRPDGRNALSDAGAASAAAASAADEISVLTLSLVE
jgi:hypothetical protein